jgi:hypothetical protein
MQLGTQKVNTLNRLESESYLQSSLVPQFSIFTRESLQSSAGIHLALLLLVLLLLLLLLLLHVCLSFTL